MTDKTRENKIESERDRDREREREREGASSEETSWRNAMVALWWLGRSTSERAIGAKNVRV